MDFIGRTTNTSTRGRSGTYLQDDLDVVGVAFALLVAPELRAAVQQRGGHPRLVGVDRGGGDKRRRGWAGRLGGAAALCWDGHDERERVAVRNRHELFDWAAAGERRGARGCHIEQCWGGGFAQFVGFFFWSGAAASSSSSSLGLLLLLLFSGRGETTIWCITATSWCRVWTRLSYDYIIYSIELNNKTNLYHLHYVFLR